MSESKVFQCSLCPFYAAYDRYDSTYVDPSLSNPTTTTVSNKSKKIVTPIQIDLNENVYLLRDPFMKIKENETKIPSIIIGGTCSVCSSPVCIHNDCSVFYTRRFCLRCVSQYRQEFPREILEEIGEKRLEKYLDQYSEQ